MANDSFTESHESDDFEDVSGGEEDASDYKKGGYHPVRLLDIFKDGRYVVVRKLGWGHFSTVWLARDTTNDRHVALKVVKAAKNYTAAAEDEIQLCEKVAKTDPQAAGHRHVVELLDHFTHYGPHGGHICMVFEVLGENLLSLIRRYRKRGGLPLPLVKDVARQMLLGLDYMHRECQVIHTDLKPENVLVCIANVEDMIRQQLEPKLAQPSTWANGRVVADELPASTIAATATSSYNTASASGMNTTPNGISFGGRPPAAAPAPDNTRTGTLSLERTLDDISLSEPSSTVAASGGELAPSPDEASIGFIQVKIADLGNACWVHKHFTEDIQTRQYRSPEVILGTKWGPTADIWSLACMLFELLTGDFLFQPRSSKKYNKDDDHLALMIETIGPFPRHLALSGKYSRDYFTRQGQLRYISRLNSWSVSDRLQEEYNWSRSDADALQAFLLPMLNLNPDKRAQAHTMLEHPWLNQS
ncbi:serine/threonine protein kinase [Dimargaris cristalligena]|uniref:non-specific serine/threonine protein kinase n=1 Tax=Dimargaris cristalligena TaxID=215637 RepID=A0A4P9ZUH8_9FUNG|nr:serine/threonine protein kinase [Dimargaris cristalligena]|eukprot:RKP36250.1 serine/threonine protein kinase [Dimargaris cristalligena]